MKISMAVGLGAGVILIIIIVLLLSGGDGGDGGEVPDDEIVSNYDSYHEEGQEEQQQHILQSQEPEPPLCDTFQCPDNLEVNTGMKGDTEDICCVKSVCPSDICPSSEFKKPVTGARGDTVEECCIDALCSASMCGEGYFLKPDADKGFDSSDCCQQKPLCSTSFTCEGEYEVKSGPPEPRGSTRDECCNLKQCSANGFTDEVCNRSGMKAKVGGVRGNSISDCCEMDTCKNNIQRHNLSDHEFKFNGDCPNGTSFDYTSSDQVGNTTSDCCSLASCKDNGWDDDECKFKSGNKKTLKYGDPRGDSVNECCDEKLCENNYYFDTRKECIDGGPNAEPSEPGMSSPCYHMGNTNQNYQSLPEVDINGDDKRRPNTHAAGYGDMKKNCAYFNMKISPKGTKMPFDEQKNTETCCKPLSCKEYSENPESGITTECPPNDEGKPGIFLEDKIIPLSELELDQNTGKVKPPTQAQCCSEAKCSQSYSDEICSDKFDKMKSDSSDPNNFTHNFPYGTSEVEIYTGEHLEYNKSNDDKESSIETCCKPKKCNEVDYICPDTHIKKTTQPSSVASIENCCTPKTCANSPYNCAAEERINKSVPPTTGDYDADTCCKPITCDEVGWTDAKCKDRTLTRAAYRGKMKREADGKAVSIGNLSKTKAAPGVPPTNKNSSGALAGDKQCCEQSEDNFSRQCVGEMWSNNVLVNGSVGADSSFHLVQIGAARENTSPNSCKDLCKADPNCTSFRVTAMTGKHDTSSDIGGRPTSPNCELFKKFRNDEANELQYKVTSEWAHAPAHTHYVSNITFPDSVRYSGGPLQTIEQVKAAGHSPTKPGYDNKDVWNGKEKVYLAGVDNEFCPHRYVKGFGIYNHMTNGWGVVGGSWKDVDSASDDPFKGRVNNYKGIAKTKGGGCYGPAHFRQFNSTELLQRTQNTLHLATTPLLPSQALDACYTEDNCHWTWMDPHGHAVGTAASGLPYQTRWDPATNYIWQKTAKTTNTRACTISDSENGLEGAQAKRRVCMYGSPDKSKKTQPEYKHPGGASIYMTRNKITGNGDTTVKKYRVGTMPYKTQVKTSNSILFATPSNWGQLLISGDNSDPPSF